MSSTTTNLGAGEALRALYDHLGTADWDSLAALFAQDAVFDINAERLTGPDAIRASHEGFRSTLTNCRTEWVELLEQGDTAIGEAVFTADKVDGSGAMRLPFAAVAKMKDGHIARLTEYFDSGPGNG
jgi:ketosteroid isomerase-like protein